MRVRVTVTLSVMVMVRVSSGAPGGCMKGLHGKSANEIRATLVKFAPAFSYSFSASVTEKCPLPEQLSLRKVPAARAESDNQNRGLRQHQPTRYARQPRGCPGHRTTNPQRCSLSRLCVCSVGRPHHCSFVRPQLLFRATPHEGPV